MNIDQILNRQFLMTDGVRGRIDRVVDLYTTFNNEVDLEALKEGGFFEPLQEMMEPVLMSLDDQSPEVIAYWAKHGMVKESHGKYTPMDWGEYERRTGHHYEVPPMSLQNHNILWNSFVPVSAFQPENKGRKYPVVFALHGAFNPKSIVDGWGFPQEAARREWILIAPSIEVDMAIEKILEEAKQLYPIDESRIYVTGFSYGGMMTNLLGNQRPDLFAACAPCGAAMSNGFSEGRSMGEPLPPFDGVPRALALNTYMPILNCMGQLDGHPFPYYDSKSRWTGEPNAAEMLAGVNSWAKVNHAKEFTLEEIMALKDRDDVSIEEKNIGLPLEPDCRHTVVAEGVTNYIGDLKSDDGVVRVRIMCKANIPHWPTPEMVRQIFEFFSHFSRDPETKASIYTA